MKNDWKFVPFYLDQQNVRYKPRVISLFPDSVCSASFYVKRKKEKRELDIKMQEKKRREEKKTLVAICPLLKLCKCIHTVKPASSLTARQ